MQHYPFVVDESPHCMWGHDLADRNRAYLEGIDSGYFDHLAQIHGPLLGGDERQYAALALRIAYSHGLETLFALLGTCVQAPECAVGWMLRYTNAELRSLVKKIDTHKAVLSRLSMAPVAWENLAAEVNRFDTGELERNKRLRACFGRLWRRFARDFLDHGREAEYNSAKHGLRLAGGGFAMAIGLEEVPGVAAPAAAMMTMGGSEFGSSFYVAEKLHEKNFWARRHTLNWNPENFVPALHLISLSIGNTVAFLKACGGMDATTLLFSYPSDEGDFDAPWGQRTGVNSSSIDTVVRATDIRPLTTEEILSTYQQHSGNTTKS